MKRLQHKLPQLRFVITAMSICLLFASISIPNYAQEFDWVKRYGLTTKEPLAPYYSTIDPSGNVFTAARFTDTISGISTTNLSPDPEPGTASLFISKIDADGNYTWAKRFSAKSQGYYQNGNQLRTKLEVTSITTDQEGNVLVAGNFEGKVAFEPGAPISDITSYTSSTEQTASGVGDIFILKINPVGNLIWAKSIEPTVTTWVGGSGGAGSMPDIGRPKIATDLSGKISLITKFDNAGPEFNYGTGQVIQWHPHTVDFNPEMPGTALITGEDDDGETLCFAKFEADGSFVYVKKISAPIYSSLSHLAVNKLTGELYASGAFSHTVDFDPGSGSAPLSASNLTGLSTFLLKLDPNGQFVWVYETLGYTISSLTIDAMGDVVSGGHISTATDFDWGVDTTFLAPEPTEWFVNVIAKHDSAGAYMWAKGLHGGGFPNLNAITTDASNNIYGAGSFMAEMTFNTTHISNGNFDTYLIKLDPEGNYVWSHSIGGNGAEQSSNIQVDTSDNIYLFGLFEQTVNFAPINDDTFNLSVVGDDNDAFILKWKQPTCNTFANISATACDSFILGEQTYTASGSYTQIMTNAAECDSVITIELTIHNTPEASVDQSDNTLTATANDASYQWIDCNTGVAIPGAINQDFSPTENGRYAVILTGEGGCSDTSECYSIDGIVGISATNVNNNLSLYPNPTRDIITLKSSRQLDNAHIRISNVIGRTLINETHFQGNTCSFDVSELQAGWYILEVMEEHKKSVLKFIKM